MQELPLAIFATGDSCPAAVRVAAQRDTQVKALACHGGLIDRAGLQALKALMAPLLMVFNADDDVANAANQRAASYLPVTHETHLLGSGEDPLLPVINWFSRYLSS
jgi:dienelactone hydrolase